MKNLFLSFKILLVCCLVNACSSSSQIQTTQNKVPDWIDYDKRNKLFPNDVYLRGYASGNKLAWERSDEFSQRISDLAMKELLESIQVAVSNESILKVQENTSFNQSNVQSTYNVNSVSKSKFDIANVKKDEFTGQDKTYHAFAYIKRQEVVNFYSNIIQNQISKIEENILLGNNFFDKDNIQQALKIFSQSFVLFEEIDKSNGILNALNTIDEVYTKKQKSLELFRTLNESVTKCITKEKINLVAEELVLNGEFNDGIPNPLTVNTVLYRDGKNMSISNVPVKFYQDTHIYCENKSDEKGVLKCLINKMTNKNPRQNVFAKIDLSNYLGVPTSISNLPIFNSLVSPIQFILNIEKTKVVTDIKEYGLDGGLNNNFIEGRLKSILGDLNFVFIENKNKAKYQIVIQTNQSVSKNEDIVFALLNGSLSIYNLITNQEVFRNSYTNVKGAGVDNARAIGIANKKIIELIQADISKWIENK